MTAAIAILETDILARANNAQADLYQCLKTYADSRNNQALISTLDIHYLTVDKKGIYQNPVTGCSQRGAVVHFDRGVRDRAMAKAAQFGYVARQFSELYLRLQQEPTRTALIDARQLIRTTYADIFHIQEENEVAELSNLLNF